MAMLGAFSSAQHKKNVSDANSDMSEFLCPVCLEIFDSPVTTQCGHTFCQSCLQKCLRPQKPACAVCRAALGHCTKAVELEALIQSSVAACKGCGAQSPLETEDDHDNCIHKKKWEDADKCNCNRFLAVWDPRVAYSFYMYDFCVDEVGLSQMRLHTGACPKYQEYIEEGVRTTAQSQPAIISPVPNRYTFTCPYCNCQNLDQDGLVEHCTTQHARDARQVVCPICASMPWGDPNYRSTDFFQHLKIRHTFSYDTFVDYSTDEHTMIQEALQRSLLDN